MIAVNPLKTKVLITTDEVIFHTPTDHQVDPRIILQCIIVAERRFIKPMLGAAVYQTLVDVKNKLVDSSNKASLQTDVNAGRSGREPIVLNEGDYVNSDTYFNAAQLALWTDYLHKIVAECVYYIALPVNRTRFNTEGMMQNSPNSITTAATSVSIALADLKHLMDKSLKDRIAPLMEDLHKYMCASGFTGYEKDCGCDSDGHPHQRKSDIVLGMYDDIDDYDADYFRRNPLRPVNIRGGHRGCGKDIYGPW